MSSAVPARWLVLCVLCLWLGLGATAARADRRPVAVINLDSGAAAEPQTLAAEIERELAVHKVLRVMQDSSDAAALRDPIDDEDTPRVTRASQDLDAAEQATIDFRWSEAVRYAEEGERELLVVTPTGDVVKLYARLAFARGRALNEDGRAVDASAAYAHAHALDSSFRPDPVAVPPNVIEAFTAATAPSSAPLGKLEVKGTGNVWIDGTEVGVAPGAFDRPAGMHVVWLTGDRETRGLPVTVASGQTSVAEVPDAEAPRRTKVQLARQRLAGAADPTARAVAMRKLADLVGVRDAVLLSVTNGKIVFQTWSDAPAVPVFGFSAHEERGERKPVDLLERLAPPPEIVEEPPPFKLPPPPPKRWYQKRSWQLGIAGAVAAAIVGGYLISNAMPDTFLGPLKVDAPHSDMSPRR